MILLVLDFNMDESEEGGSRFGPDGGAGCASRSVVYLIAGGHAASLEVPSEIKGSRVNRMTAAATRRRPAAALLVRPAVDTEVGTGHLPSLWAIRFVTPNPSLCDLNIGLAMDWERVQSLFPAHLALHAGMILFHPDADGPDWPHRQVTVACRHPTPDVENMRPCCVPEGCGSALDGKRRGTPARAQALLRRAEVAVCREDPARYPERSF